MMHSLIAMRRASRQSIGRLAAIFLLAGALTACGSPREEADLDRALELGEKGDAAGALAGLMDVESKYPGSEAARRAGAMRPIYEGLLDAQSRYRIRQSIDLLRQTARAIETYRMQKGKLPADLQSLDSTNAGNSAESVTIRPDPWGRALRYATKGSHYDLSTEGSDASPGGTGDAMDLEISDGELIGAPGWVER